LRLRLVETDETAAEQLGTESAVAGAIRCARTAPNLLALTLRGAAAAFASPGVLTAPEYLLVSDHDRCSVVIVDGDPSPGAPDPHVRFVTAIDWERVGEETQTVSSEPDPDRVDPPILISLRVRADGGTIVADAAIAVDNDYAGRVVRRTWESDPRLVQIHSQPRIGVGLTECGELEVHVVADVPPDALEAFTHSLRGQLGPRVRIVFDTGRGEA
jgi:hypothetical protein